MICRLLLQNANGFEEFADDTKTNVGLKRAQRLQVGALSITEHHLNMRHPQLPVKFSKTIKYKIWPSTTYGSSCITDPNKDTRKLYGGTSITAANGWNSRICEYDTDIKWAGGHESPYKERENTTIHLLHIQSRTKESNPDRLTNYCTSAIYREKTTRDLNRSQPKRRNLPRSRQCSYKRRNLNGERPS